MIQLFQQRDFGSKINATIQYVTQNFRSLFTAMLYIVGPVALVAGTATGIMQSNLLGLARSPGDPDAANNPLFFLQAFQAVFSPAFAIAFFFGLLAALAVTLVVYSHMKIYARKTEQGQSLVGPTGAVDIPVAEVWAEMQSFIGKAIVFGLLSSIIAGFATLFFIIPGIYVAIVLSLGLAVTCFENTDFGQTWSRCFTLIRNKWWSTFGLILVMGIISGIVGLVFTIPSAIIGFLMGAKLVPGVTNLWLVLGYVIATVGGSLLRAIIYIAIGFQYTNLVERLEGRGLISSIDSIGTTPSQPRALDEGDY